MTEVPPMIRQGELVDEIGRMVARSASLGGDWESATLHVRRLAPYGETQMVVLRPSGRGTTEDRSALPNRSVGRLVKELRDVMYWPGAGTWLSMELTVSRTSGKDQADARFNYDDRPAWTDAPAPALYSKELHRYPRDPDHIPAWLRDQLNAG
ncbi:hypothetical protein [Myceligenerans crystallogenes]|uniref:Uncharacterized protein n=1 Tax=Myceligenerans crystallogenes TaxID=316335 RepID=A0ABP4ZLV4_9MICO